MSEQTPSRHESRILELLADRALCGLTEAEQAELESLCREHLASPSFPMEFCELDAAAAQVAVEACSKDAAPPASLMARLEKTADDWCAANCPVVARVSDAARPGTPAARGSGRSVLGYLGWVAAAACVGLLLWLNAPRSQPSVSERMASFERAATDIKTAPWGPFNDLATGAPPEQTGVTGEVAWSESRQQGFITFKGLKPNDPAKEQYQLWIVDRRGLGQRISGALFDARPDPVTGEVVVPIDPRIAVDNASIFALTIEKPGGVWVSDMTRRVVLAQLEG